MRFLCFMITLFWCVQPVLADENKDQKLIALLESTLQKTKSLQARFVQIDGNGGILQGNLWLERPGKMRVEYDAPAHQFIVANHGEFIIANEKYQETSRYPLDQTPLYWLLGEEAILSNDKITIQGIRQENGIVEISMTDANYENAGMLKLLFTQNPTQLRQWSIIDQSGNLTRVSLNDPIVNIMIDPSLFKLPRYTHKKNN